jgi:cyclopropane-fatty-acyl-phospholipid synthase
VTGSNVAEGVQRGSEATGVFEGWMREGLVRRLRGVVEGRVTLVAGDFERVFGGSDAKLDATITVRDPRFYRAVALGGTLGAAEAYMDGHWVVDDLTALVRIMIRSGEQATARAERGLARLAAPALVLLHTVRRNTRTGARRNIASHYDLGNDFFELFLDPTLTYSSGIFERPDASMEQASIAKYDRICRKLRLSPSDHLLEIGSGWGGFALHAAGGYGCRVTTTTISREQLELATQRVREAGLAHRVEILEEDYRDLAGRYDKLVSIEMIEAVGHRHLDTFFRVCSERLRSEGAMLLQAITVPDQDYEASRRNVEFIKRYIFPGGQLVSVGKVCDCIQAGTDLRMTHLEDITPHYAETLSRWRARMLENLDAIRGLGLSERFIAMWRYYLCYCEGGFRERAIGAAQLLFEKPGSRRPSLLGGLSALEAGI